MVEVRLGEPAVHLGRDRARLLGGAVRGGQRLRALGELLEHLAADRLARLDDDDRGLRALGDRLGEGPKQRRARVAGQAEAYHDEVRVLGLAEDRRPDVGRLAQDGLAAGGDVLAGELGEGVLGLGPDRLGHALGHEVLRRRRSRRA